MADSNSVHDLSGGRRDELTVRLEDNNARLAEVAEVIRDNQQTMIEVGGIMRKVAEYTNRLAIAVERNSELIEAGAAAQQEGIAEIRALRLHMENESTPALERLTAALRKV
jgi:hypothetical protein